MRREQSKPGRPQEGVRRVGLVEQFGPAPAVAETVELEGGQGLAEEGRVENTVVVGERQDLALGRSHAGVLGPGRAWYSLVHVAHGARGGRGERLHDVSSAVGRAVVDHNDLLVERGRFLRVD